MDVVLYVFNDVRHDSRVLREAGTLAAAGHRVTVMGTTRDADEAPGREARDGFAIERVAIPRRTPLYVTWVHRPWRLHRRVTRNLRAAVRGGARVRLVAAASIGLAVLSIPWVVARALWEVILRAFRVPSHPTWVDYVATWTGRRAGWCRAAAAASPRADVHHANDAETLPAALRAARRDSGRVVYDSHEIFTAWGPLLDQPVFVRSAFRRWERRLARRAAALVTINDEIAGELARLLAPRRTVVVHNCPPRWTPPAPAPDLLRRAVGIPATAPVVLCHGNLQAGRGLEETAEAMMRPGLESAHLVFLGYGRMVVASMLDDPRLGGRVHVLDPVPPSELLPWVASADVDVMAILPTDRNSVLSSPNKLFESIAAGVPVVTSDLPVRRRIVLDDPDGPLGALCDPTDPESIAAAIRSILSSLPEERAATRARILAAAHARWNWEREGAKLVDLYDDLAREASPAGQPSIAEAGPATELTTVEILEAEAETAGEAHARRLVTDTAWTPADAGDERLALRSVLMPALRAHRPLADCLAALDAFAARTGMVERLDDGELSWWCRRRLWAWRWLHDRAIWTWALESLPPPPPGRLVLQGAEAALLDAARAMGIPVQDSGADPSPAARPAGDAHPVGGTRPPPPVPGRSTRTAREAAARARLETLGVAGPRPLLVLTDPRVHQIVGAVGSRRRLDPFLASVIDPLRGGPLDPVVLELGVAAAADRAWDAGGPGYRGRTLPGSVVASFANEADDVVAGEGARRLAARLDPGDVRLEIGSADFGPLLVDEVRRYLDRDHVRVQREIPRIARAMGALRPAGILCINEYSRPEWLAGARRAGVPVAAVQHGIIHPWHPGYVLPGREGFLLPDRTYLFGDYERRILTEQSVFRPDEVRVAGAPRLDLAGSPERDPADVAALRAELGVEPSARVLVFSSTSSEEIRRLVVAPVLDALTDGALPGVHLVVKLHPAEADGAFYERLFAGLGAVRPHPLSPLTVVRDVDLYRLLRAADAHLGIHSTVLTDAVAAGTRNLVATTLAEHDLLGYVAAGVARPVRDAASLLAALEAPPDPAEPAARAAFLADHFAEGAAGTRIATDLQAWLAR